MQQQQLEKIQPIQSVPRMRDRDRGYEQGRYEQERGRQDAAGVCRIVQWSTLVGIFHTNIRLGLHKHLDDLSVASYCDK